MHRHSEAAAAQIHWAQIKTLTRADENGLKEDQEVSDEFCQNLKEKVRIDLLLELPEPNPKDLEKC